MPRVPTYDEFQVAPQAAPATRVENSVSPAMMSVAGDQMQQAGRGLQSVGDAASKIVVEVQKDINDAVTKEADNQAAQTISKVMGDYLTSTGKDAVVSQEAAKKTIEDALRTSGEGLQNDMQRRMYGDVAMRRMQSALGQIDSHAAGQAKQWNVNETEARMGNARRDATTNWVGWNEEGSDYQVKRATMLAETDALMKSKFGAGPDDEMTKAARLTQTTGLAADTIQNMLVANQSKMATEYFDRAMERGDIDPAKAKPIQDMIKSASVKDEALTLSLSLKGGLDGNIKQLDTLFKEGKITAEVHDAAAANVEHRWQLQKSAQAEYQKSVIGQSTDWFIHNSGKSVLDFETANPVLYTQMKQSGHLTDLISIAHNGGKVVNDPQTWADVMTNTQELKGMTPTDIFNKYRTKLDDSHLEKAYALNAALNGSKDEQHLSIMSTTDMVKDSAVRMGILPATGKAGDNQAKQFNDFQSAIDAKVAAYEATELGGKRKASQTELKKILQEVEMDKVYKTRTGWFDKSDVPLTTLKPDELSKAYVKVGDEEISLGSIPAQQRALIIPALRKAGQPVTEQNIANYWVRGGKKK